METLQPDDPRELGSYRLLRRLGAGGMGRVYLARSPGGRTVAVKVVRPDLAADADFRRRFQHEVEIARAVSGRYTAPVVDADPDAALPWLATSYVLGPDLTDVVEAHGTLPEPRHPRQRARPYRDTAPRRPGPRRTASAHPCQVRSNSARARRTPPLLPLPGAASWAWQRAEPQESRSSAEALPGGSPVTAARPVCPRGRVARAVRPNPRPRTSRLLRLGRHRSRCGTSRWRKTAPAPAFRY